MNRRLFYASLIACTAFLQSVVGGGECCFGTDFHRFDRREGLGRL